MKKFTALMLVVLMVVSVLPFSASAATWTKIDTAEEFAAMKDGNYWLTADIDLSKVTWTTMKEFKGTLNGNGKTVTVPKDAPIFDVVSGTIKNVNLKGDMTLVSADASKNYVAGDVDGYGIGILTNNAYGATFENVNANVNVTFKNDVQPKDNAGENGAETGSGVSFGLIGFARADYKLVDYKDGEETKKELVVTDHTVIKNSTVAGNWDLDFVNTFGRNNAGAFVGSAWGNVDLSFCISSAVVQCKNSKGNKSAFVGHINQRFEGTGASKGNDAPALACTLTDLLFDGEWNMSGEVGERFGGFVGYGRGAVLTRCVHEGKGKGSGTRIGLWGYCNSSGGTYSTVKNVVDNCLAIGPNGGGTWVNFRNYTPFNEEFANNCLVKNMIVLEENKLNGYQGAKEKDGTPSDQGVKLENNTTKKTKAEVREAFLATTNNFELKGEVLTLKMPTFTPSADPSDTPAPTGDMTFVLVGVAVVSLAAVTVIAKKKVTD